MEESRERTEDARGQVVLACADLDADLAFFTARGFRLLEISPADDPARALLAGYGLELVLERAEHDAPATLRVQGRRTEGARELVAPNGTRIVFAESAPPLELPPLAPELVVTSSTDAPWRAGRAGMLYRDLVPGRQGGRFIASHIRIESAGPVPDYVHYHRVRFQMIYCRAGSALLVYEDQGEPFLLRAGDCVLQPPEIRHRVLESSAGLEVVEIGSPARHATCVDHALALPTGDHRPERSFGGQRFVHHQAAHAARRPWRTAGLEARDLGIAAATGGLAGAWVLRATGTVPPVAESHAGELAFTFVLAGGARLALEDRPPVWLRADDAFVVPAGRVHALEACSRDLELLHVTLPADAGVVRHAGMTRRA